MFKELVENSEDIIIVTDSDFNIRYISSSVTTVFGFEPPSVVGREHDDGRKFLTGAFPCLSLRQEDIQRDFAAVPHRDVLRDRDAGFFGRRGRMIGHQRKSG